jgi:hypothetical protein
MVFTTAQEGAVGAVDSDVVDIIAMSSKNR